MKKKYNFAIRDPVHSYIEITSEEGKLIDAPFLQRMRWISQLSGVRLVFPGAQHTRLAHVLGVMHLAGTYAEQVSNLIGELGLELKPTSPVYQDVGDTSKATVLLEKNKKNIFRLMDVLPFRF